MRGAAAQEVAATVLRHPTRPRQMCFPRAPGADWLADGIDRQYKLRDFSPICSVGLGVQQAQIGSRHAARHSRSKHGPWARCLQRVDRVVEIALWANPSRSLGIHVPQA